MARFLFVTWDGGGNEPPAIGIAQALRARGHDVFFAGQELAPPVMVAGYETQGGRIARHGFPFLPLERAAAAWATGEPGPGRIVGGAMACAEHLRDLPEAIARARCDLVVVDCLLFGALAAVERADLPAVTLVHSAPGALCAPGDELDRRLVAAVNGVRAAAGLPAVARLWDAWARLPTLCTTIPALDPPAGPLPVAFEYVGPAFSRVSASGWRAPWPTDDPRPLVLASFASHGGWDQRSRIGRTLAAVAGRPYRVLATTSVADVGGLAVPDNVVLLRRVPHAEVLPGVAVAVNHAGHGSIALALAHGVPLVCLPNPGADQPPLAARVAALGAGLALDGEEAGPDDIAAAIGRVIADARFAATAREVGAAIVAMPGTDVAAARLEQFAGLP